jgi:hypothetical protein
MVGAASRRRCRVGASRGRDTGVKPTPEDEIAALFRSAYGGDANVELSEHGLNLWVQPADGGSVYARLEDVDSPVLAALLGVYRMSTTPNRATPD